MSHSVGVFFNSSKRYESNQPESNCYIQPHYTHPSIQTPFSQKTLTLDIKLEYSVQLWDPHYKKGIKVPFMELINCLENKFYKISLNKAKYLTPSG